MELALVLPILVLLIFGALEIGRVFNAWIVVTQASREGARVAAVKCATTPGCSADVTARVEDAAAGLPVADIDIILSNGPYTSGQPVTVRVEYDVPLVVPLISALFPGPTTVKGKATMRLE